MSTVAEKLNYLNNTRLKIKDGLNKFGADLTENDTFRSYSNVLNDIYGKLPKVSGNGSNFTLESVQKGKLDLFEMEGNTEQQTYTGKNLNIYPYATQGRDNGITFTINEDGTVILNGQNNNNGNSSRQFYYNLSNPRILEAGTYYIIPPSNNAISYVMYDGTNYYDFNANNNYSKTFNVQKEIQQFYVQVSKGNTTTFTNEKVYPMLSITPVTADDYEKFVGGVPSPNPDYPQDIRVVTGDNTINVHGKNLLNVSDSYSVTLYQDTNIYLEPGNYVMSFDSITTDVTVGTSSLCNFYHNDNTFDQLYLSHSNKVGQITITAPVTKVRIYSSSSYNNSNGKTTTFTNLMIEKGSTATEYQPYQSKDYEINLGNIELCKIGNYQDKIYKSNGKWYLHKEFKKYYLKGFNFNTEANSGNYRLVYQTPLTDLKKPSSNFDLPIVLCSHYTAKAANDTLNNVQGISMSQSNRIYIYDKNYNTSSSASAYNTWLQNNNPYIIWQLSTPTETEITDETLIEQLEEIETETGTNIFEVSSDNAVLPSLNVKRLKELEKLS